jgi:peptide/nickel transport system permease protein
VVIGGFRWMPVARLVRAQFFSLREKEFVEAARALGASTPRQVVRHILPNSLGPVIVAAPSTWPRPSSPRARCPSWAWASRPTSPPGAASCTTGATTWTWPHWALFPGLAIFITVLTINFIGDGLRDALDPRRVLWGAMPTGGQN